MVFLFDHQTVICTKTMGVFIQTLKLLTILFFEYVLSRLAACQLVESHKAAGPAGALGPSALKCQTRVEAVKHVSSDRIRVCGENRVCTNAASSSGGGEGQDPVCSSDRSCGWGPPGRTPRLPSLFI